MVHPPNLVSFHGQLAAAALLALLVWSGNHLQTFLSRRMWRSCGRGLPVPGSVVAGALAVACEYVVPLAGATADTFVAHWHEVSRLTLPIAFAALYVGLRPLSIRSLVHEASWQLCYGMIVSWGQYLVSAAVGAAAAAAIPGASSYMGVIVPMGLEGAPALNSLEFSEMSVDLPASDVYMNIASLLGFLFALLLAALVFPALDRRRKDGNRSENQGGGGWGGRGGRGGGKHGAAVGNVGCLVRWCWCWCCESCKEARQNNAWHDLGGAGDGGGGGRRENSISIPFLEEKTSIASNMLLTSASSSDRSLLAIEKAAKARTLRRKSGGGGGGGGSGGGGGLSATTRAEAGSSEGGGAPPPPLRAPPDAHDTERRGLGTKREQPRRRDRLHGARAGVHGRSTQSGGGRRRGERRREQRGR